MIKNKHGVIITFGSVTGEEGSAMCVDYAAAKSAMHGVTKGLAQIGAPHGVRACCVIPGPVLTRAAMANWGLPPCFVLPVVLCLEGALGAVAFSLLVSVPSALFLVAPTRRGQ